MTTKTIAAATAQIALNKNIINMLHMTLVAYQGWRYKANKEKDDEYVAQLNAAIKKNSRQIKQYVVVQKAAKKHLAQMIANSRCSFYVDYKQIEDFLTGVGIAENVRKYNDVRGMEPI